MNQFKLKYIIVLALLISSVFAEWSVVANVDRTRMGVDDNLTLTIIVTGDKLDNLSNPRFDGNDDWAVMNSGTSTSTSFQIINGRTSQSRTVTTNLILAPKRKGVLQVPRLPVSANGETKHSDGYQVEVVDGSLAPAAQPRGQAQQRVASAPAPSAEDVAGNIFLTTTIDKNEVYVGEQVTATFTLYSQYNLGDLSMSKDAVFNGFWAKELYRTQRLNFERKTLDGKVYNAVVLSRHAVFPLTSGEKTIEPMELDCSVLTRRDFWGFFSQGERVKVNGKSRKVTVKPLPSGAPTGFAGLVGDFSVTTEASTQRPKTNEAFSYIVTVSGTGNIHILDKPQIQFPRGFDLFDVQETQNMNTDASKVSGTRRWEFILVPRSEGEFELPAFTLHYFKPSTKRYETFVSKPIPVVVEAGKAEDAGGIQVISRGEVMRVGEDIRFIAPDRARIGTGRLDLGELKIFLYLLPLELLLVLIGFSIDRKRNKLERDVGYARYTRALKRAMKELKAASANIGDSVVFAGAVQNSILHYLWDRLGLKGEELVFNRIRDRLAERRVDDATLDEIEGLLERLDFLRFAPGEKEKASRDLLDTAKELIKKVDRVFK